jgi:cyclomaltodextrinase
MKTLKLFVLFSFVILVLSCSNPETKAKVYSPPEWASKVIWYQIFVERFSNGDTLNDPRPENISTKSDFFKVPENWKIAPWTQNWYQEDDWAASLSNDFYSNLQLRRYGGDLQGVMNKLSYLSDLGITAIYFNPLNDAPSLHKYDARNYHHIDVNFGPDPAGDMKMMATENPNDPSTWKWTSADRLFLALVDSLHKRNIRVILDYSWNHTGVEFWTWKDILEKGKESPYKDWYSVVKFDDLSTAENEFDYRGWLNIKSLPEIKKVNTVEEHRNGYPFEGDLNPGAKAHVLAVTKRWLSPDGDLSKGIDGYRLDVADHVPMGFWRDYCQFVKTINPEAILVGEIWWEEYPDNLMNPVPYLKGEVFDAIMFYQAYRPARYFFAETDFDITAQQFKDSLDFQWNRLRPEVVKAMMNTASTHDTPRLLSTFNNRVKYKFREKPAEDQNYHAGKPTEEVYRRVKLYLIHQFTNLGAPHIWNGEEMGMWGADDPDCRKPVWWPEFTFEDENRNSVSKNDTVSDTVAFNADQFNFYKQLIQIRKSESVLSSGDFAFLKTEAKLLVYKRFDQQDEIIVCLNAGKQDESFDFPIGNMYLDLISGEKLQKNIRLKALEGRILKRL